MQDIKELVLLLKQHSIHPLKNAEPTSKLLSFYDGVVKGQFPSDEVAANYLYEESPEGSKYRKLKYDLRERLFDNVLQIHPDQKTSSDYQKAYYECHRQWAITRILSGQSANTAALVLSTRLLKQAEKFDLTLLGMDISSYMRTQYGLRESNDRKFREMSKVFESFKQVYDAENRVEEMYTTLIVRYVNNRSAQGQVHEQALLYYEEAKALMHGNHSYKLQMYGYLIGLITCTTVHDWEGALRHCTDAIHFFETRPYEARVPLQIFYYQRMICHVQLRQYTEGSKVAEICLSSMQEGTFNWFKFQELYLQLLLHTRQYDQAAILLFDCIKHPKFEFLPMNAREIWRINEGLVYWLTLVGAAKLPPKAGKFKIDKFFNNTPIFSRDKGGINVTILIVKLLHYLAERRFSEVIERVEALDQYCYRHLRGEDTKRSYYFIKMLLQMPLSIFDADKAGKKAEKYQEKMSAVPLQVANQTHELEIIPYDHLWELALETLKKINNKELELKKRLKSGKK